MTLDRVYRYGRVASGARLGECEPARGIEPADRVAFPQAPGALGAVVGGANLEPEQAEDAFVARVQAPELATGLPVVVFVPGGGFLGGTGNARWFDAADLVERGQIVLITLNYRIGALGHLGDAGEASESQRGLRDLVAALTWVHDNAAAFGGDPDNITLSGDSAGAWLGWALATMPETAGLFRRAAFISLPYDPPLDAGAYAARREVFFEALGRPLAAAPIAEVLEAQSALAAAYRGRGMALLPAVGGPIPSDLHDFARSAVRLHVDELLLMSTTEETAAFLAAAPDEAFPTEVADGFLHERFADPARAAEWIDAKRPEATGKQRMVEAQTLFQFGLAHLEIAAAARVPTFVGSFAVPSPRFGVSPHCHPLPFLFGANGWEDAPMLEGTESLEPIATELQDWILAFARTGDGGDSFDPAAPRRRVFGGEGTHEVPSERDLVARR